MRWGVFSVVFQLVALGAGIPFGPVGVAIAYTVATFCLFIPALAYAGRPLGIGARDVIGVVGPQTVAALVTVAVGFAAQRLLFDDFSHVARLLVSVPICVATYLAVAVGAFKVTAPLRLVVSLVSDFTSIKLRRAS
jgi:PST family polysaccharide transporter